MKILIVSWFFPPYNAIGAVRVGKFAKFLHELGHEVRVISGRDQPLEASLPVELPEAHVLRTPWINFNAPAELALGGRAQVKAHGFEPRGPLRQVMSVARTLYKDLLNLPDAQIGWTPFAVLQGTRWLGDFRPDVIFASAQPVTSLIVGAALSRRLGVPWVADLRDLLDDPVYYTYSPWRRQLDGPLIDRLVSTASTVVTVSEPLREIIAARWGLPTELVLNGFDPADFPAGVEVPRGDGRLHLVHTGTLNGDKRDPRPLFEALASMGPAADAVRVHFYGRGTELARRVSEELQLGDIVVMHGAVPYAEALRAQASADLNLLILHNHPSEKGIFTGKLFEYLGARRPILALGPPDAAACALIAERRAGLVLNDPAEIATHLRMWVAARADHGPMPPLDDTVSLGLTRLEQTRVLEGVLRRVAAPR